MVLSGMLFSIHLRHLLLLFLPGFFILVSTTPPEAMNIEMKKRVCSRVHSIETKRCHLIREVGVHVCIQCAFMFRLVERLYSSDSVLFCCIIRSIVAPHWIPACAGETTLRTAETSRWLNQFRHMYDTNAQ